ncbi:unnamed protein product, partial [Effrenium voratum]
GNFTGVRCAKQTRGVWQLWTMSAICSGLYTGLAPCGLRAPGGLAPSVPLGKPSLQSGTGLRMRSAYGDLVFERECAAGAPCVALPSAQLHRSLPELEAMSTAKLKNVARELQDKGGNCLPIAPGHREGLIAWILKAQDLAPSPAGAAAGIKSELGELADRGVALQQPAPLYVRAGSVPAERADRRRLRAEARLRAEGQKPWEGDTFHARRDVKELQDVTREFLEAGKGAKTKMLAGMSTKATMNGHQSQRGISPMLG